MQALNEYAARAEVDQLWQFPELITDLVNQLAGQVFRTDVSQPGFAVVDLGQAIDPQRFRSILIGFYAALDGIYLRRFARRLLLRSVGRFDQKVTTEPHLDGAPEESILMLGYEPSEIISELFLLDYTHFAADRGMTPAEFLERFDLRSESTKVAMKSYANGVATFDRSRYSIVIINNSRAPLASAAAGMLGVLHQSTVSPHKPGQTRLINTLLMSPGDAWDADLIPAEALRTYINSGVFATI